jgi:DNA mismatch repair protein MutS2
MKELTARQSNDIAFSQLDFAKIIEQITQRLATPFGTEQINGLEPSTEKSSVEKSLKEVSEMMELLISGHNIPLKGMTDFRKYLEKIKPQNAFLDPEELIELKNNLRLMGELSRFFKEHLETAPLLNHYSKGIHYHTPIIRQIESTIDPSGEVLDRASPELRQIRVKIRSLEADKKSLLKQVIKQYAEFTQDEIITLRDGRMVLGIQQNYVNKVDGIVHGTSSSGATIFVEPMTTLQLSNKIQNLRIQERNEVIKILRFLTDLIRQVRDDIFYGLENVAILDFVYARANLAQSLNAKVPKLTQDPLLKLSEARHPLLVLKLGREKVVPQSIEIGKEFHTLVITGPNAGGKTVAIKTIGLLILMTQIGMPIPASEDSTIALFPKVLVDIGDRQSLEQDLSTFSAHIIRLKEILKRADQNSLVLLDEVGTGTDPKEGAALAISILSQLTEEKVITVATTHHGELKAFAHTTPGVENASMEFNMEDLQPNYRLRVGIPGSSYAFEIARRYGLPAKTISLARKFVGKEKDKLETLILNLEKQIQELEKEKQQLSIKLSEGEGLRTLYERQANQLKKEKKSLQQKAAEDAEKILRDANALVERIVAEIRSENASRQTIKSAHKALKNQKDEIQKILKHVEEPAAETVDLNKGDVVWIKSLREEGELLEDSPGKNKLRVLIGNAKITLDRANLEKLDKTEARATSSKRDSRPDTIESFKEGLKPELDLRGLDSVEAIEQTDKYLSEVIDAGWEEIRIVHGKGTGVLRKKINEYLSRDKRVLEKRIGKWGEGDTGVTVVKLRK